MDLYNTYIEELREDTKVDEISLKEKALFLPGIKAKWVARLINHKNNISKLEKKKTELHSSLIKQVMDSSPIKLHSVTARDRVEVMPEYQDIISKLAAEKNLVEFLEKIEKIFSSMSFDISNIVKIIQLETT